ncbi:hypothetical protein M405DRAFT_819385 [Rhizopogon salebrosus TDB-379]|nr:hypothetical protein M405DRAFT_819385 [Rhizopogon salebrosus TDB-379]
MAAVLLHEIMHSLHQRFSRTGAVLDSCRPPHVFGVPSVHAPTRWTPPSLYTTPLNRHRDLASPGYDPGLQLRATTSHSGVLEMFKHNAWHG